MCICFGRCKLRSCFLFHKDVLVSPLLYLVCVFTPCWCCVCILFFYFRRQTDCSVVQDTFHIYLHRHILLQIVSYFLFLVIHIAFSTVDIFVYSYVMLHSTIIFEHSDFKTAKYNASQFYDSDVYVQ